MISVDDGENTFESRLDVEQEIVATKRVRSDAIASKDAS